MPKLREPIDPTVKPKHCPECHSINSFQHNPKRDIYVVDEQGNSKVGWMVFVCGKCGYDALTPVQTAHNQNLEG